MWSEKATDIGYTSSVPWREMTVCFSPMSMEKANFLITVSDLRGERRLTKYPVRKKKSFAFNEKVDLDLV